MTSYPCNKNEQITPSYLLSVNHNIPRACLPNRLPVPAMDLKAIDQACDVKMLETCYRLRRLCRKGPNNVARHDKTPVKSTLLSRDMSFMSSRNDIML